MLRGFGLVKDSAVKARTETINQPDSRADGGRPALREALSGLSNRLLIGRYEQLAVTAPQDVISAAST